MQAPGATGSYMTALTAVLLQAAIADPDLVQALLADQHCWPALLAVCTPKATPPATHHAHRLEQLGCSRHRQAGCLPTPTSPMQQDMLAPHSFSALPSEATLADVNAEHQVPYKGKGSQDSRQGCSTGVGPGDEKLLQAACEASTAGAAGHVAQLMTVMVQSQAGVSGTTAGYVGLEALEALLHCYSRHAKAASSQLPAPVWPAVAAGHRQQQAMLQHVAEAGGHPFHMRDRTAFLPLYPAVVYHA